MSEYKFYYDDPGLYPASDVVEIVGSLSEISESIDTNNMKDSIEEYIIDRIQDLRDDGINAFMVRDALFELMLVSSF